MSEGNITPSPARAYWCRNLYFAFVHFRLAPRT